jgi:hypothetical protein
MVLTFFSLATVAQSVDFAACLFCCIVGIKVVVARSYRKTVLTIRHHRILDPFIVQLY